MADRWATPMPKTLSQDPRFWFLKHTYWKCEPPINSHWAAIVCNESGKGKSYLSMSVVAPSYPDFDPAESMAFTPERFVEISKENHPRHFPLIMDDASLSAFSGDALTNKVKNVSKVAQTIRHKHWQIILNLPNFELMAKSVRVTNHYYLEPVWIDYDLSICHAKFQRLFVHPFTGKMKRYNMTKREYVMNPVTGYPDMLKKKILTVPIPKPSDAICRTYENMKNEAMSKFREETNIEMIKARTKELRPTKLSGSEISSIVESTPQKFSVDGKFDWTVISKEFKIADSTAMQLARKLNKPFNIGL